MSASFARTRQQVVAQRPGARTTIRSGAHRQVGAGWTRSTSATPRLTLSTQVYTNFPYYSVKDSRYQSGSSTPLFLVVIRASAKTVPEADRLQKPSGAQLRLSATAPSSISGETSIDGRRRLLHVPTRAAPATVAVIAGDVALFFRPCLRPAALKKESSARSLYQTTAAAAAWEFARDGASAWSQRARGAFRFHMRSPQHVEKMKQRAPRHRHVPRLPL